MSKQATQSPPLKPYAAARMLKLIGGLSVMGGGLWIWLVPIAWFIGVSLILISLAAIVLADMSFDLQRSRYYQAELNRNYEQLQSRLQTLMAQNNEFLDHRVYTRRPRHEPDQQPSTAKPEP
jgi:hypothetical protein